MTPPKSTRLTRTTNSNVRAIPTATVKRMLPPHVKPANERRPRVNNAELLAHARPLRPFNPFGVPELLIADSGRELCFREVGQVIRSAIKGLIAEHDTLRRDAGDDPPGASTP